MAYFKVVIGNLLPTNEYVLCALFAGLIITAFFRGPLTLFGCGAATLGVPANVPSADYTYFLHWSDI